MVMVKANATTQEGSASATGGANSSLSAAASQVRKSANDLVANGTYIGASSLTFMQNLAEKFEKTATNVEQGMAVFQAKFNACATTTRTTEAANCKVFS